jgi:hypothetical protein
MVFAYQINEPSHFGMVTFDDPKRAVSTEEKLMRPKSNDAVTGSTSATTTSSRSPKAFSRQHAASVK